MSGCAAKEKRIRPAKTARKVSIPNTGDISSEKKAADREAFWAGALESTSMLAWIVAHSPNPDHPFLL